MNSNKIVIVESFLQDTDIYLKVNGMSMYPFMRDGDIIKITKITAKDMKIGDIILFKTSEDILVAHRLISKNKETYLTKGDARLGSDSKIMKSHLVGRTSSIQTRNGIDIPLDTKMIRFLFYIMALHSRTWDEVTRYLTKNNHIIRNALSATEGEFYLIINKLYRSTYMLLPQILSLSLRLYCFFLTNCCK